MNFLFCFVLLFLGTQRTSANFFQRSLNRNVARMFGSINGNSQKEMDEKRKNRKEKVSSINIGSIEDESNVLVGRDRVLFQVEIDLKWLYSQITDRNQWKKAFISVLSYLSNFHEIFESPAVTKSELLFIASDVSKYNAKTSLKFFSGSLSNVIKHGYEKGKYIFVYVEDGESAYPSNCTINYRKAFANSYLGDIIDRNFIFYATSTSSNYQSKKLFQMFGSFSKCPVVIILTPYKIVKKSFVLHSMFDFKKFEDNVIGIQSIDPNDVPDLAETLERFIKKSLPQVL